uniref:Sugar phosphate transporter domain-containing protein n=1 Tax=Dunaliella tertiolecta TaxID=3047 RepID=A0A6S8I4N4_DUNTE|mmetsp:Transcript_22286/g.58109  ORF Transcript_22286/g.58109 Transcript_22286/m.58109 type:complete len:354 (-) Transcript_22286:103-1164(-)|eukprot:CAMPEP_0202354852 /NCGR_PEP_ID=MMETSP1126-20121109/9990_1 /ASSEMBLY_ACC=CAM_ASM_000457 /TAXON_ID=3047 /ORGANISM="Dunaliella tertiolecta, Strain CCMP1320" /LENGTH=353 /DNA_ID=CAMNT_0048947369 /DNA_START=283 /DNA_END=1344 /DNA_ORIENTATION=+
MLKEGLSSTYKQRGPNEDVESVRASRPLLSPSNNDPKAAGPPRSHNLAASFSQSWLAGSAYVLASSAMILFNKHALSGFNFECPSSLLLFHCLLAVVFVKFMAVMGYHVEPLRWSIAWRWMPVNLLFVGMIVSSFFALKLVGVGMFTVLKNLSSLTTMGGDYLFFGKRYGLGVWACVLLMILSACAGGMTDANFSWSGYSWQIINCFFTSGYALYLSKVLSALQPSVGDNKHMTELSLVYYNNVLSLPPIALLALASGEFPKVLYSPALWNPQFQVVAFIGAVLGCAISYTSLWYMSTSTATLYSLTGGMNKVIVATAGIILFDESSGWRNLLSIAIGLAAGLVFVFAKTTPA